MEIQTSSVLLAPVANIRPASDDEEACFGPRKDSFDKELRPILGENSQYPYRINKQDSNGNEFSETSTSTCSTVSRDEEDDDLSFPCFDDEENDDEIRNDECQLKDKNDADVGGLGEEENGYRRHGRAILTDDQAREIFRHKPSPDSKERDRAGILARTYGISVKTVRDIWVGRTWYRATVHLDPSKPVSVERLQKRPGRPRGAKDSRPRTRKWPRFDTTVAALGLDPRLLLQLADAARAGGWHPAGSTAAAAASAADPSAFDVVAAAARFFALAPLAFQRAAAAASATSPAAAPPASAAAPPAPQQPAPAAQPYFNTPPPAPRPALPPPIARSEPASRAPPRDSFDPFQSDFAYWTSAAQTGPAQPEPPAAGDGDGDGDWGEPLACNLRLRFDPVACSREWGAPWPAQPAPPPACDPAAAAAPWAPCSAGGGWWAQPAGASQAWEAGANVPSALSGRGGEAPLPARSG